MTQLVKALLAQTWEERANCMTSDLYICAVVCAKVPPPPSLSICPSLSSPSPPTYTMYTHIMQNKNFHIRNKDGVGILNGKRSRGLEGTRKELISWARVLSESRELRWLLGRKDSQKRFK